jgi:hypothetical protein
LIEVCRSEVGPARVIARVLSDVIRAKSFKSKIEIQNDRDHPATMKIGNKETAAAAAEQQSTRE